MKAILFSVSLIFIITSFCSPSVRAGPSTVRYVGLNAPDEEFMDTRRFALVRISIIQAISCVGRSTGGTVLEIGFVVRDRSRYYSAIVSLGHQLRYARVDATTSVVTVNHKRDVGLSKLTEGALRDVDVARSAKIKIEQAAERVEKAIGGHVISLGVEELGGIPQYYIQSVIGLHLRASIMNPNSGELSSPQSIG